jgi:protein phosphatase
VTDGSTTLPWRRPVAQPPVLRLDAAVVSIAGPRPDNQDAAVAGARLLAVADGVGGNVGGAVAAALAVQAVSAGGDDVAAGVATANERIAGAVADDPGLSGMATTLTAALLVGSELAVAHIGDSRAYLFREGRLRQLTHDQTLVQALLDAGVVDEEQARRHPLRSVVLGALHGRDEDLAHLVVDAHAVRSGDRLLLCSDGLSGVVAPEVLARVLAEEPVPAAAATRLVRDALAAGTQDNVTAVVAHVVGRDGYALVA